jgi:NADP+-dependent farnesol dehydrogenase
MNTSREKYFVSTPWKQEIAFFCNIFSRLRTVSQFATTWQSSKMQRWLGKVGVVTGCCAGIGAATTIDLIKAGMIVVGLDLQPEKVGALKSHLPADLHKNLHVMKCNVGQEPEIVDTFGEIQRKFGGVDVLINNAGVLRSTMLIEPGNTKALKDSVDVNIMGLVFCSREAIQSMRQRTDDGHIVLINSILGHRAPMLTEIPSLNIYAATKHAVTAILETFRQELISVGSNIKVTVSGNNT